MIAKLVSGNLVQCRKYGRDGSWRVHTDLPSYYAAHLDEAAVDGYYPVVFVPKPEGNCMASWTLQSYDGRLQIVQVWTPCDPQPEPVDVERLRADVDYIAMMEDIDLGGGLL